MKFWFAILFSVLVAGMQPALMANTVSAPTVPECCHKCATPCCEATPANSDAPAQPAAPAPTVSQNDLQFVYLLVTHLSSFRKDVVDRIPSQKQFAVSSSSVPIFQRDCSYLI